MYGLSRHCRHYVYCLVEWAHPKKRLKEINDQSPVIRKQVDRSHNRKSGRAEKGNSVSREDSLLFHSYSPYFFSQGGNQEHDKKIMLIIVTWLFIDYCRLHSGDCHWKPCLLHKETQTGGELNITNARMVTMIMEAVGSSLSPQLLSTWLVEIQLASL